MKIPQMTKDLAIIQKLSDLPNSLDGLTAAELKAKFDEAGLSIQNWINNDLVPAMKAENLPFAATAQLNAADVQAAIELVFEQVRGASSGTITNGSVTKEKLAQELLERVFGGRVWVSLDEPSAKDNPDAEFPVGQLWLKPGFKVVNETTKVWTTEACTSRVEGNAVTVTGDNTLAQAEATMSLPDMGQDGDRVYVLFQIKDKDSEMTSLTVSFNKGEEESAAEPVHQATLAGGSLKVRFHAEWPSTSLANGSYTIENLAVVNIDKIMRQTAACREKTDWGSYLQGLLPISDSCYSPRELYIQTVAGVWKQLDHEVFPVERGGTGVDSLGKGEMLYGSGGAVMEKLAGAGKEHSLLMFSEGVPTWKTAEEAKASINLARCAESEYENGTGKAYKVELPGKPRVLWLIEKTEKKGTHSGVVTVTTKVLQLFQGMKDEGTYNGKYESGNATYERSYTAFVLLNGNVLEFSIVDPAIGTDAEWLEGDAVHWNDPEKQYRWVAIY